MTEDFRHRTPKRRENPEAKNHYSDYKPELREDFNERCGYCGDHDFFRQSYYEIDHFVPRKKLKVIALNDYSNLVYACRSCNNAKRAKWPTGDEKVHNDGKVGFIDPLLAAEWASIGLDAKAAKEWAIRQFPPILALQWFSEKYTPDEALNFVNEGYQVPFELPEDGYHGVDVKIIAQKIREKYGDNLLEKDNPLEFFKLIK